MLKRFIQHKARACMGGILLAVALVGCSAAPAWQEPGPAAVFEGFLMDWFRGDREAAVRAISDADRAQLGAALRQLTAQSGAPPTDEPGDILVVGRVNNPYDFKSIKLAQPLEHEPEAGQVVQLELNFHDGRQGRADMVWSGARWQVKLPLGQGAAPVEQAPAPDTQPAPAQNELNPLKTSPTTP